MRDDIPPSDVDAFERAIFKRQVELLNDKDVPQDVARRLSALCRRLATAIRDGDIGERISILREMNDTMIEADFEVPN